MRLHAQDYPVRVDGVVFAFVDARTTIEARVPADPTARRTASVTMRDVSVRLPEQSGRTVQRLDQHPEVVYEDQPGFAPGTAAPTRAAAPAPPVGAEPPLHLEVDARQPFWVRRNDFSIQLDAALSVDRVRGATRIAGPIRVRRGVLELVGKSFDLSPGEVRFDGGLDPNPQIDLTAVHTLASRETVTVHIGGRLARPELSFSTTVPGVETEREILELLVRGRGGETGANARDQAVSMLSGLTAGLLSSLTRRELGAFLPVLAIDSTGTGGTRVRAGVQTDRLIPRFLRGVVQGAYVEGFVGTGGDDGAGGQASSGGFLVEFYLPRDLVGSGTFEEPDNWSVDLSWAP
jgi:translocation and assembly module TamB